MFEPAEYLLGLNSSANHRLSILLFGIAFGSLSVAAAAAVVVAVFKLLFSFLFFFFFVPREDNLYHAEHNEERITLSYFS